MPFKDTARVASIATRKSRAAEHVAATMALIQEAQAAGAKANGAIAEYLNAQGSRTPLNCPWTGQRVSLLRRQSEAV
jgi:hypothetical protein